MKWKIKVMFETTNQLWIITHMLHVWDIYIYLPAYICALCWGKCR